MLRLKLEWQKGRIDHDVDGGGVSGVNLSKDSPKEISSKKSSSFIFVCSVMPGTKHNWLDSGIFLEKKT